MAENNKEIHIVFQVLNFVLSPDADDLKLLPIDRLFLLALAKHQGIRGIYPTTNTLASELNISPTYVKRIINRLDAFGIIKVDRKYGTTHHYHLLFLSTDRSTVVDVSTVVDRSTTVSISGQPQFQKRSTTVDTININNQFRTSKQRERKKAAPISPNFLPDEKTKALITDLSIRDDLILEVGEAFIDYFLDSGESRKDWQFECRKWFKREVEMRGMEICAPQKIERVSVIQKEKEIVMTDKDRLAAKEAMAKIMSKLPKLNGSGGLNGILGNVGRHEKDG